MTRRIFVDTEWTAAPWAPGVELMWVGLADEHGHAWHGVSSEVEIDPSTNPFVAGMAELLSPGEPRLTRQALAQAVVRFCGPVDEFWAWIPTRQRFAEWFSLGDEASQLYDRYWNVDLQMMQALVTPWPAGWPGTLMNLQAAAAAAQVELPPRHVNHLHPRVHAAWNRQLFDAIRRAGGVVDDGPGR